MRDSRPAQLKSWKTKYSPAHATKERGFDEEERLSRDHSAIDYSAHT
jgi:hypothetical protein